MESLISVIVPVYKVEKYLARCIDSILVQTYSNLEIILVDDGSPDNCGEICDNYACKDSRIQVIHKKNEGLGFARNSGMEICNGEYIMFLDSDDYISPDAVQVLFERITADGSDIAVGKHADAYEDGSVDGKFCEWMQDSVLSSADVFTRLGEKTYISVVAWAKLYKRSVLNGVYYPNHKSSEDLWVFPAIIDKCDKISVVNKTVLYYYQRPDSILHAMSEQAKRDDLCAVLQLVAFLWERGFEKSACRWYGIGIDKAMRMLSKKESLAIFRDSISHADREVLLHRQTYKKKLKWAAMYVPGLYEVLMCMKHWMEKMK